MKRINDKIIFSLIAAGLLAPLKIFALEINWPASPAGTTLSDQSTLTELTKYSYEWVITLGILAFFVSIVINGVKYMTSTGDPGKVKSVRQKIQSAASGLGLLLFSWVLLSFLNPRLTTLFIPDPNQPLSDQLVEYDISTFEKGACDLVILYHEKNYKEEASPYLPVILRTGQEIPQANPIDINYAPHSLRVLKKLTSEEKSMLQQRIDKENEVIKKKNEALVKAGAQGPLQLEKTLEDAVKENYGDASYSYHNELYVNTPAGCAVYFYRKDPKLLINAFGTIDVVAFQFYTSTPDFNILYSEEELSKVKRIRAVSGSN